MMATIKSYDPLGFPLSDKQARNPDTLCSPRRTAKNNFWSSWLKG